jgi:hypothetical protein
VSAAAWTLAGACLAACLLALVVRSRRRGALLPVADAGSLGSASRRTWLLWAGLAGAAVLVLAAFFVGTRAQPAAADILPPRSSGVIVIDLSSSTRSSSKRIAASLLGLARDGRQLGLVVFSDTAYEALPPSAPVESLRDWLRLFAHEPPKSYPWTNSFSGGTWISSGLVVARRMLRRDGVKLGHVLLVSDLVDGPSDLPNLQSIVSQYQREGIDLGVIAVKPVVSGRSAGALTSFLQEPNAGFVEKAATRTIDPARLTRGRLDPVILVALAGLLALVATAHELLLHPFTWRVRP